MEFKNPSLALISILAALLWSLDFFKIFYKPQIRLPSHRLEKFKFSWPRSVLFLIGLVGWILISIALTGPRRPLEYAPQNIEVNDIFLVVDVSRSMLADDLPPNRLEAAKEKLREFAALKPKDRFGIIVFSEKVFTLLPLTIDPQLVDEIIQEIQVGVLGAGTNIGDALGLAVARAVGSDTKNKVIILLTDGVSNTGNLTPMQAAENAKKYGIKVYTIAIGTDGDARLPVGQGPFGMRYQSIPGGSIDLENLKAISSLTGGKSFLANSEDSLKEILSEIEKLERTEIENQSQIIFQELFHSYLWWGILLFLLQELGRRFILRDLL